LKPVNPVVLKDTLMRVISLREYLQDRELKKRVHQIDSLPTQPERYLELVEAIPSASLKEIVAIIQKDVGITVKILQLVNSPFFGLKSRIEDIYHAISLIGVEILRALVLTLEIFAKFQVKPSQKAELREIFNHSSEVAGFARLIAMEVTQDKTLANDSYMGGLIHDVGRLIILSEFSDAYFKIKKRVADSNKPAYQVEREILNVDHSQLGAYLLGLWGLPELLVETAAHHHSPSAYLCKEFSPLIAVHIADAITYSETNGTIPSNPLPPGLDLDCLNQLDPSLGERIPALIQKINEIKDMALD
jgi:HD-like signal output (HDOD) protein